MSEKRIVVIESADECPYCDEYVRDGELRCAKTGNVCVEGYGLGEFPSDCPLPKVEGDNA